jgi:hypothetical protein
MTICYISNPIVIEDKVYYYSKLVLHKSNKGNGSKFIPFPWTIKYLIKSMIKLGAYYEEKNLFLTNPKKKGCRTRLYYSEKYNRYTDMRLNFDCKSTMLFLNDFKNELYLAIRRGEISENILIKSNNKYIKSIKTSEAKYIGRHKK